MTPKPPTPQRNPSTHEHHPTTDRNKRQPSYASRNILCHSVFQATPMHDRGLAPKIMNCQRSPPWGPFGLKPPGRTADCAWSATFSTTTANKLIRPPAQNEGRRNAYSTTELTDSRQGVSCASTLPSNAATGPPATWFRHETYDSAKTPKSRHDKLNAAPHHCHRDLGAAAHCQATDASVPNRSSAALAGESRLQWQRVVTIGSGATAVRLLPAMPTPPRT